MLDRMAGWTFGIGVRAEAIVRYLWLNVLWLVLSLTVVGAPAAAVAMHAVVAAWARGDERGAAARFVATVREHGWRASAAGLVVAMTGGLLLLSAYVALHMNGAQQMVTLGSLCAVAMTFAMLAACVPSVVADGASGPGGIACAALHRAATRPLSALAAIVLIGAVAAAAFAFPPALLVLPAPFVRLVHELRTRRGITLRLPRTRIERNYA